MKHIKLFEQFLNERQDDGLFWNNSPKNRNKFLFEGETDTLTIPVKRAKVAKGNVAIGNNYNFGEFAKACDFIGPKQQLGRDRYDIYPEFKLIIPSITEMTFSSYSPVFNSKSDLSYSESYIKRFWQEGVRRDGYYWMMNYGGSVKVNTKTIRERFESYVGRLVREHFMHVINWESLNIQYKGNTFNPLQNENDKSIWISDYTMDEELLPAYQFVAANMPTALTMKIYTLKY